MLVTDRPESFAEMEEEAMEMYGLPFLVLDKAELKKMPGNLILDLNLWENQLDRFQQNMGIKYVVSMRYRGSAAAV